MNKAKLNKYIRIPKKINKLQFEIRAKMNYNINKCRTLSLLKIMKNKY